MPTVSDLERLRDFWRELYRGIMFRLEREDSKTYRRIVTALAGHGLSDGERFEWSTNSGPAEAVHLPAFPQLMLLSLYPSEKLWSKVEAFASDQDPIPLQGKPGPARLLALYAYYGALWYAETPAGRRARGAESSAEYARTRVAEIFDLTSETWKKYLNAERANLRRQNPELLALLMSKDNGEVFWQRWFGPQSGSPNL